MSECNCYHGMDCSKISVCAAEGMVENAVEELEAQLDSVLEENRLLKGQLDVVTESLRLSIAGQSVEKAYSDKQQAQLDAVRECINGKSQLRVDVSRIMKALGENDKESKPD